MSIKPQIRYVPWKGLPHYQISSVVSKNGMTSTDTLHENIFSKPHLDKNTTWRINKRSGSRPLKHYRRELPMNSTIQCTGNIRTSGIIDIMNRPQGYLVNSTINNHSQNGLITYVGMEEPNSMYENGNNKTCNNRNTCIVDNAKRRVRSSGMIRKQWNNTHNTEAYFTNTNQYLVNRNRTFSQNQYNLVRYGSQSLLNPSTTSNTYDKTNINVFMKNNTFSPNGLYQCSKFIIHPEYDQYGQEIPYDTYIKNPSSPIGPTNNSLGYYWIDNVTPYEVFFPYGSYSLDEFNQAFIDGMSKNNHYYINKNTNTKEFLLKIIYNSLQQKVEIQCLLFSAFSGVNYDRASNINVWSGVNAINHSPVLYVQPTTLQNSIGFRTGNYPSDATTRTTVYAAISNIQHGLFPMYTVMYYKPNNARFAQQGAASSSALISRKKYDTIVSTAKTYDVAFGKNVANALSYRISENLNSYKEKLGYPMKNTPIFKRGHDGFTCTDYKTCNLSIH